MTTCIFPEWIQNVEGYLPLNSQESPILGGFTWGLIVTSANFLATNILMKAMGASPSKKPTGANLFPAALNQYEPDIAAAAKKFYSNWAFCSTAFVTPIVEELLFRGLFNYFAGENLAVKYAIIPILFGITHIYSKDKSAITNFTISTLFGVFQSALQEVSNSLTAPITAHIVSNVLPAFAMRQVMLNSIAADLKQ